jgi:hypothetical protein
MSSKAVIVWLLLAIAMGVAALVLLRTPAAPGPSRPTPSPQTQRTIVRNDRLMDFAASQVTSITIARPDGRREIIERAPQGRSILGSDAEWQLRLVPAPSAADAQTPPGPPPAPWPLNGPQVLATLRILAELTAVAAPAGGSQIGPGPTDLFIATTLGERRIRLAARTLAGSCLAEVSGSPAGAGLALIDAKVQELFTSPGPTAWREPLPLAGLAADASRVILDNPDQRLVLARVDGRWSVREPVPAPADSGAVSRLLAQLGRIRIVDFLDQPASDLPTGLDKPVASLAVEVDRRSFEPGATEPTISTLRCLLTIGAAADAGHARLFASITSGDFSRTVLVEARGLAEISMAAGAYIWPHPSRQNPSDVGSIVLDAHGDKSLTASRAFKRSLDRWSQLRSDGTELALADTDLREVDVLLGFLTGGEQGAFVSGSAAPGGSPAPGPRILLAPPEGLRVVGRVTLLSVGGGELETMELARTPADMLVIRTGDVYREYPPAKVPALLMLVARTGIPVPASPAPASTPASQNSPR